MTLTRSGSGVELTRMMQPYHLYQLNRIWQIAGGRVSVHTSLLLSQRENSIQPSARFKPAVLLASWGASDF